MYNGDSDAKKALHSVHDLLKMNKIPGVIKLSEEAFAAYGPPTSVAPIGYAHVYLKDGKLKCSLKNCSVLCGTGKQQKMKRVCIHQHMLFCFNLVSSSVEQDIQHDGQKVNSTQAENNSESIGRKSSININMERTLPYLIPIDILMKARKMDAATTLGLNEVITNYLSITKRLHFS